MAVEPLYEEGEWIVHSRYGVGQVLGKDKKQLNGKTRTYLKVKTANSEFWLPANRTDVDHIRPVAYKATFTNSLTTIRKKPELLSDNFRLRQKHITEVLDNGALIKIARLIRDLNARQYSKQLTLNEQEVYSRIKKRFIDEWAISAGIEPRDASRRLDEALMQSINKIEIED
jgi:RNA polymerase-interacting CarD/CdnL/TRCF family regulator